MKNQLSKSQFEMTPRSHGVYFCKFTSAKTGKVWKNTIFNMQLIDDVKPVDYPTQAAMNRLKDAIKLGKNNYE